MSDPVRKGLGRTRVRPRLPSGGTTGVFAALAGAGLLFSVSADTASGTELREDRSDLPGLIRAEQSRVAEQEGELEALRAQIDEASRRVSRTDTSVAALQSRVDEAAPSAGLAAVLGPALRVTLDDAPRNVPVPAEARPDDLVVHQQDVQAVVNALWQAGAEAMMLQDQRVVSTSAVRCVGNTLILQGRVYSPPYEITAIGDVDALGDALDRDPQIVIYRQYVDAYGLGWQVQDLGTTQFPAFSGSLELRYASTPGGDAP